MLTDPRVLVVGAGTAGLAAALELARRGESVLMAEASDRVGGALHVSWAQMSAAGTILQEQRGIDDSPDAHFADVMRISRNTADPTLVRRAVDAAPHTVDWLLASGFDMDPACPALHYFHEPYSKPRTYWGRRAGQSVLDVLERERARWWSERQRLALRTRLTRLVRDGQRISQAVLTSANGEDHVVTPEIVILATGGYAANADLFPLWTNGYEAISPAAPSSDGSGIAAALGIGAVMRGGDLFLPTFGGVEDADAPGRSLPLNDFPQLVPQDRAPWEIYIDAEGRRFVAEDDPSVDVKEHALLGLPGLRFWIVFDDRIRQMAPPLFPTWSREQLDAAWERHPAFIRAGSLGELAKRLEAPVDVLHATVESYNQATHGRQADAHGRQHLPLPIAEPPFYAILNRAVALKSPAGLTVDGELHVLGSDGARVENLFAIGEAIGGSTLSGRSFVGGMSVTPALSFGRQLGRAI